MFEYSQGDFPIKTPWKASKIRAVALGRFVGWQIHVVGSELDREMLQQGSKTHCRYLEWIQQRQVIHLLSGMPTQLLASFHQQCPFKPIWKTQNAPNMCRQINILTLEFYGGKRMAEPLMGMIWVWSRACSCTRSTRGWWFKALLCTKPCPSQTRGDSAPTGDSVGAQILWFCAGSSNSAVTGTGDKLGHGKSRAGLVAEWAGAAAAALRRESQLLVRRELNIYFPVFFLTYPHFILWYLQGIYQIKWYIITIP